jgi:hypothetical protein
MKQTLFFALVVVLATANGQTINTEKSDRTKVIRVQTVMNHLSIIELAEPVTEVAAGSPAYKVEWRGNKVFVQPLEPEATTNLFIWTASGRLNYELVAVSAAADAEFAIDQEPGKAATPPPPPAPAVDPVAAQQAKLASEMLFGSDPVRLSGELQPGRVQILIKDVYRSENKLYVRYAIQNDGRTAYQPSTPDVFTLRSPHAPISLIPLKGSQLAGNAIKVTAKSEVVTKVVDSEVHASIVPPGSTTYGLVAFEAPKSSSPLSPSVIRFDFPPDSRGGDVKAFLVF